MNTAPLSNRAALACVLALCVAGCSLLKPSGITPRKFVLTPIQSAPPASGSTNVVIGMRTVRVPGYLSGKGFAMRKGNNEIEYLEGAEWAERVDNGLQHVVAANLSALIPTDQVRLSLWTEGTVSYQIEINVEQFDVEAGGKAVLNAWWRVLSGKGEPISSGRFSETRNGPAPKNDISGADISGAVASLSTLVGDFSQTLVQAIRSRPSSSVP
jgi:uncharacterized lipoprotein YmbA